MSSLTEEIAMSYKAGKPVFDKLNQMTNEELIKVLKENIGQPLFDTLIVNGISRGEDELTIQTTLKDLEVVIDGCTIFLYNKETLLMTTIKQTAQIKC